MMDKDIEERLKTLRELYLDKRSENDDSKLVQEFNVFNALTTEEKEKKIISQLDLISKKLLDLDEKLEELNIINDRYILEVS